MSIPENLVSPVAHLEQKIIIKLPIDNGDGYELHFFCSSLSQAEEVKKTLASLPPFAQYNCNDSEYVD